MERAIGWLIGWVIGGSIAGWRLIGLRVSRWLSPRSTSIDVVIERWSTARAVVGFVLVVVANLVWDADTSRLAQQFSDAQLSFFILPFQVAASVIAAAAVLIITARRGERGRMLRNVMRPVRVVGIVLVILVGFFTLIWGMGSLIRLASTLDPGWQTGIMLTCALLSLAIVFVGSAAAVYGVRAISKSCFRARDGHPAMPAYVAIALSCWTLSVGVSEVLTTGWESWLPQWAAACLLLGGPLLVILLSGIEIIRLRRFRIPLRCAVDFVP